MPPGLRVKYFEKKREDNKLRKELISEKHFSERPEELCSQ